MPLQYEKNIYNQIRKLGFTGDVYSRDMILFEVSDSSSKYIVNDGQYTIEKHTQILISLLKEYGIKNVIVSPGICNINFVYSIQNDPYFRLWSCVDERSAGYMACGIAQTTGEPVALSCTGATASRNYMSALTEAYYSKLPILAITSSRDSFMVGNGIEQITDRRGNLPKDIVRLSTEIAEIHNIQEKKYCEIQINRALSMLKMHGGGPVHVNLVTRFEKDFTTKTLPKCRVIKTITEDDDFPQLEGKIGLYIRPNYELRSLETVKMVDAFCEQYNAVVIGDHLSNYTGRYFIDISLLVDKQRQLKFDILLYTGSMNREIQIDAKKSWRISPDGEIEDPFLNLEYYFDMSLQSWLKHYNTCNKLREDLTTYKQLLYEYKIVTESIPELPFSNLWVARQIASSIPANSICYFGIFSTLRNWSYVHMDSSIQCYSTVGGYGIDGTLSSMMGASFANPNKLCFCFLGDLSFFYDINVLGNKNIRNNVRILVFNNGGGNSLLFRNGLPEENDSGQYVAAIGHFDKDKDQSRDAIKAFSETMGFQYLCATEKKEFICNIDQFTNASLKPILFEVRYAAQNDLKAIEMLYKE